MTEQKRSILEMNAFSDGPSASPLLRRRQANMGPATILFYREPIELRSASGVWLEATDGTRYLDCYNNVPSVGHCHPRVTEAISHQIGQLNVHSRYLCEPVEAYMERLRVSFPPHLAHAVLTCSGSEANDLAMRMAKRTTGNRGFIVTQSAYHGNTAMVADVSPSSWKIGGVPSHVRMVPAPSRDNYGEDIASGFASAVSAAAIELNDAGYGLAAFICDSIFSSDGVYATPEGFLAPVVDVVHAAGGIYVADEVQPGFGRLGHGLWGFSRHGVAPDIVTMGKPMGNGFPMAGLVVRHDILDSFCQETGYFNTFGGNPVAAAAGLAVLDCIRDEGLIENAHKIGEMLVAGISSIVKETDWIRALRGAGLFLGLELADGDLPASHKVVQLIDALRMRGVLIGAAGCYGEALKVRPPLCMSSKDAEFFLDALRAAVKDCA